MDKKAGIGQLDCKVCGQKFQCSINCKQKGAARRGAVLAGRGCRLICILLDLSAAVDVYGDWVDAAGMPRAGQTW